MVGVTDGERKVRKSKSGSVACIGRVTTSPIRNAVVEGVRDEKGLRVAIVGKEPQHVSVGWRKKKSEAEI